MNSLVGGLRHCSIFEQTRAYHNTSSIFSLRVAKEVYNNGWVAKRL
jgi:hypothetical protein